MAKFTRRNLSSGYGSTTQLNFNFEEIEDHLNNKVLYRDNPNGEPNQMENELDMNSHTINNLGSPDKPQDAARLKDILDNASALNSATAVTTSLSDDNNYFDSENVEGVLKKIGKEGMMWVDREDATFQSSSALSLSDDKVNASRPWTIGDRVKVEGTSTGTVYGTIDAIDYNTTVSGSTYVSISLDSGSLSNEALTVCVGAVSAQNPSIGSAGMKDTGTEPDQVPTNAELGGLAYQEPLVTLTSEHDLDDVRSFGFYAHNQSDQPSNLPIDAPGYVLVRMGRPSERVHQLWTERDGPRTFTRTFDGSTWSEWVEFWHTGNLDPETLDPQNAESPSFFTLFDDYTPIEPPLSSALWAQRYDVVLGSTDAGGGAVGIHKAWSDRVRPHQVLPFMGGYMCLYSSGTGTSSITTSIAFSPDGIIWYDSPLNPILDQLDQTWQGNRSYGEVLVWDDDNERWALFVIGNDTSGSTPGDRAGGVFFSDPADKPSNGGLMEVWTPSVQNPIFTVNTGDLADWGESGDTPVRIYCKGIHKINGVWHGIFEGHFLDSSSTRYSRIGVMTATNLEGPWSGGPHNPVLTADDWDMWSTLGGKIRQPVRYRGRYYAPIISDDFTKISIAHSDDFLNWSVVQGAIVDNPGASGDGMDGIALFPCRTHWAMLIGERASPKNMGITLSHYTPQLIRGLNDQDVVT